MNRYRRSHFLFPGPLRRRSTPGCLSSQSLFSFPHGARWTAILAFLLLALSLFSLPAEEGQIDAYRQGVYHRSLGHRERALQYFNQALNQDQRQADLARMALLEMRVEADGREAKFQELLDGASQDYMPALYRRAGFLLMDAGASEEALDILLAYSDRFPEDPAADDVLFYGGWYAQKKGFSYVSATLLYAILERYPESELSDDAYILLARHYYLPGPDRNPDRTRDILIHFAAEKRPAFVESPYGAGVQAFLAGRMGLKELFSALYFPVL
ncbi:MAG: hypothetical protein KDK25_12365 [Leptospiraceae bacterium]|nr:hypothetical protein [Leptospiraceae bacterium]